MKKLFCLISLLCLPMFAATPNVPLYVHWDGTIAAPTQFLNATFKAGSGISFTDNRTNLTIVATGGGSTTNSVIVAPGTGVTITTNVTTSNVTYTVSATGGSLTNIGALCTNVAYTTNLMMDFSALYNDYYMTNALANHLNICPTNLVNGAAMSLSIQGATSFTNYMVYVTWPTNGGTDVWPLVKWLSITNGAPTTYITSNKWQFYSFLVRTSYTTTNIMCSFKEEP